LTNRDRPIDRRTSKTTVWPKWLAGFLLALGFVIAAVPAAQAETRTLKLFFIHTKEKAEITFKRNGRYDQAGLKKINMFLRDWRRNEPTKMDPRLLDLVWETYRAAGASDYIHVVSAYRSPATNSMLRKRSKGVANKSQHMLGKAMDFYIPGVSLKKLRDTGLRMQTGGVGYYPRSGSPFVHLDVGNVRHWPRMSRRELAAVFPNGKTLHVPSDGKPLPGFETALASYESRKKNGTTALALASSPSKSSKSGGLLSALFGGGADEEEDNGEGAAEGAAVASAPAPAARKPSGDIRIVPPELANPASGSTPWDPEPADETPEAIIAALPARDVPLPVFAPRPQMDVGQVDVGQIDVGRMGAGAEPGNMPFGMAEVLPQDGGQEIGEADDANVPLPSWRPDLGIEEDDASLVALIQSDSSQPESDRDPALEEAGLAGLSSSEADDIEATIEENNQRLAVLTQPAEKAVAALARETRAAVVPGSAKTTAKSDRARVGDTRPAPKPVVVAAQPDTARWALETDTHLAYAAGGPSIAHLSSVASEVYATGFRHDTVMADAGRFTGKAITFLPVARFQTN
jgi:uncharacterized protein YcbK (DUF882 family)